MHVELWWFGVLLVGVLAFYSDGLRSNPAEI